MKLSIEVPERFTLVQEGSGIHIGISTSLPAAGKHAAQVLEEQYLKWRERDRFQAWGQYKRQHFTIAVGGGNTIKAQYNAWLANHLDSIDWLNHVRFFFLEDTTGETGWESAEQSLSMNFIVPLATKLLKQHGRRQMARQLQLHKNCDSDDIIDAVIARLVNPINLAAASQALEKGDARKALQLARKEARRYEDYMVSRLGASLSLHCIVSGVGKDGTLGAFAPYTRELSTREPGVALLKQPGGALRIALNRGVLTHAEHVSLIVAGNRKLQALGRFEMDDSADFEQTVMETPLRMLRETREIAERVYIFADEQALNFEETVFEYNEEGEPVQIKAETRAGDEDAGIHILLLHGFMGLFSFANLLIRLPSAWTVSALHRGSKAKLLDKEAVFPHYARALRKAILHNWRKGRPVPIAGHSIAGVISDHMLLSLLSDYRADIVPYRKLGKENRQLVDALRSSGIIHLATWSPCDGPNTGANIKSLVGHVRNNTELDYTGLERIYETEQDGALQPSGEEALADSASKLSGLDWFLQRWVARPVINGMTIGLRSLLNNQTVQQRMLNAEMPYAMRLVGGRLLKTASLYGLAKEINAALHDPVEYQRRHLKALDIMLAYDIPFLSIVHEDDFLVSARRHTEEHEYLVQARLKREGVSSESALKVPARLVILKRQQESVPVDPLNPHLLVMSTSPEGNDMARQITAAITRFVNENVARAMQAKRVPSLASVTAWQKKRNKAPQRKVA